MQMMAAVVVPFRLNREDHFFEKFVSFFSSLQRFASSRSRSSGLVVVVVGGVPPPA